MQPQVQILTQCPQCNGEAYLPDLLITCDDGSKRLTYAACMDCGGSGHQKIWGELTDLLEMLTKHCQRNPLFTRSLSPIYQHHQRTWPICMWWWLKNWHGDYGEIEYVSIT